jgi:hypothetical protein
MRSLTEEEARAYCTELETPMAFTEEGYLIYEPSELPRLVVKAPTEMRQMINFILTLTRATKSDSFLGGFVWFHIYDVGVLNSAYLGWKVIEDVRRANGDNRTLDIAPAQHFRENEETEQKVFLLQAIAFGWNGSFLPSGLDCFVEFTSSQRWFFYSRKQSHLDKLFEALAPWSPAYESYE